MTFRRAAALVAATSMLVGGLAACGDEEPTQPITTASPIDKGTDSPSESSSSSTSSSKGGAGELPPATQEKTKAGAVAFTKLWFEESGKALRTGDVEWLRAHTDSRCIPCTDFLEMAEQNAASGLHADRNPMKIGTPSATARSDGDGYRVSLPMKSVKYSLVDEDGTKEKTYSGATYTFVTHTRWSDDGWALLDWITK